MPIFGTLSNTVGTKNAVALLSTGSFCARTDTLLPVLDRLSGQLGTESAVRPLSCDGFCVREGELMAKFPEIQSVLGEKGAVRVLSNPYLVTMDASQWGEFMKFVQNAQPGDTSSYLGTVRLVGKCKKVGWGVCSELYRGASQHQKTRAGFEGLVDAYAQEAL
ncbi:hypothetical protein BJ741DRAFT_618719 [Chytriomyces cf. hyalinus JEL632]|nr:hypothetical protein BJ741DRAFT_618719 [Chytriomyces cf. hyalinus JEL632]